MPEAERASGEYPSNRGFETEDQDGVRAPVPGITLRCESLTVDRSGDLYSASLGPLFETVEVPIIQLWFDYGSQRIFASDERERFVECARGGLVSRQRDALAERRARCVLEGFGAIDIECLDDCALSPETVADYLIRLDADIHDYCGFTAWVVPQLEKLGWRVEIASDYPYRVVDEEAPSWFARVSHEEDRPDWFGLHLGVELEGRSVNLLPALVRLLDETSDGTSLGRLAQSKRRIAVPLPDGRYLTVPPEAMQTLLRVLSELYDGSDTDPEALVFSRMNADTLTRLDEIFTSEDSPSPRPLVWQGGHEVRAFGNAVARTPRVAPPPPPTLKATLRSYQREGVAWLDHLRQCEVGGVLADDMGLGKTLQTIAFIAQEKHAGRMDAPVLVISPTSLTGNWDREIAKFAPSLRTLILRGPDRHRHKDRLREYDVVITSYPILVRDEAVLSALTWYLLILDEAHVIKNTRSRSHQSAKRLDARHRLCITGTPVENHLGELFALFDFLNPGMLGDELSFRRWFRVPIEQEGDDERLAALRQRVAPYLLRRLKREVAKELPEKTELLRPVTLGRKQRELYESIRVGAHRDVRRLIQKKGLAASTLPILDALTKLRQVCCDPRLVPMRAARGVGEGAKYKMLFELLEGQLGRGHRILIFSQFTQMLDLIARGLEERATRYLMLTGQSKDRQLLVDRFEGGEADVFLISLKAGGVGLTLTRADTVIHYDPWWNPAAQDQATDRAYRIGQTQPVVAYNLFVQGSVEERMLGLQRRKRRLAEGILDGGTGGLALSEDDIEELFAPLTM